MNKRRIVEHPVLGKLENQEVITFSFDGRSYKGYIGDTIASGLLANGIQKLRVHEESGTPRGIYCNIGHCFECRVTVDHQPGVRACMTELNEDMVIESGKLQPLPMNLGGNTDNPLHTYDELVQKDKGNMEGDSDA